MIYRNRPFVHTFQLSINNAHSATTLIFSSLTNIQTPSYKQTIPSMCPSGSTTLRSQAATSEFRPAFDVLDADRDGKISRDDLRTFYAGFADTAAVAADEEIIGSMISVADSNKDGFVEYEEFERVLGCKNGSRRGGGGLMEEVFKVMDKDGDGKVSHDDLKSYMSWAGFSASDEDIRAMIRLGGGDEKEGVSYDGLLKILAVDFVY